MIKGQGYFEDWVGERGATITYLHLQSLIIRPL